MNGASRKGNEIQLSKLSPQSGGGQEKNNGPTVGRVGWCVKTPVTP